MAQSAGTVSRVSGSSGWLAQRGLKPIHARATANAKRLGKPAPDQMIVARAIFPRSSDGRIIFSMPVTKAALATTLFEQIGLNRREANDLVDRFFEDIAAALEAGDGVKFSGFGNFNLREKRPRPGRNPKTGQQIPILARRVVTFHPSSKSRALIMPPSRDE
jgi:integration host factor subunit alpha